MDRLCLFFNTPSLYRKLIYSRIDQQFDCDWYFGDFDNKVKSFDTSCLQHPVHYLNVKNPGKSWSSTEGVLSLLRNKKYNRYLMIGEVRDISTWRVLVLKNLFYRKKKVYFWTHGWYGKESRMERTIKRLFYRLVDGVFLYGNYAKELMVKEGIQEDKLFVIHNSLDYDTQLEIRKKIKPTLLYHNQFHNSNRNILFLGRLTDIKRLDILLEAISLLQAKGETYNVTFVGDGEERKQLEQISKDLKIADNVWFYGACYDEVKNSEFVYNADLCVSPGNVGLTAMHMLMFGTPVITHNRFELQMPEFEAIVPNKTGLFFEYGSASSLADKIHEWFQINGGRRDEIRLACYEEIDTQWTPDFQMSVLCSVLK